MERIVVTISSDLFDETDQEASLRKNISVRTLISEIQKEFSLPEGQYALRQKGQSRPLEQDKTFEQLGILTGAQLVFTRERRMARHQPTPERITTASAKRAITGKLATLRADNSDATFEIRWTPALIGRAETSNPASAAALAVNLGKLPDGKSVSRQHASITERDGIYLIESLSPNNPVKLNGDEVYPGERRSLKDGDRLLFGKVALTFHLQDTSE